MSDQAQMRAMVMTGWGGPEVLETRKVARPPAPQGREIRVALKAAGVNAADWKHRSMPIDGYNFGDPGPEMILGLDGAGIVDAIGGDVTRFAVGDKVYFVDGGFGSHPGNYQEYKLLHEDVLAPMPASFSFAQAAAVPTVLLTAWEGLVERANIQSGDFVLVHAGAGGVGHMAVQVARLKGARVAATVSGREKAEFVASLGAECVINYREEDVGAAIRAWSGKDGADIVYDTVGGATFAQSLGLVAPYGTLVCCASFPWPSEHPFSAVMRGMRIVFENMGLPQILNDLALRRRQAALLEQAGELFDTGRLQIGLAESHALESAGAAQLALENGRVIGRVVLDFDL